MQSLARRTVTAALAASAVLTGAVVLAAPAHAAPSCTDPVARALHTAHEAAGPAGGPVHLAEDTYCGVKP